MTALLALDTHPFLPGPGTEWAEPLRVPDAMPGHVRPVGESDEELGELIDLAAGPDRQGQPLLVLYPHARQARVDALLRVLRQVSPAPIARVGTRLPPLSAAVLALLLQRLGSRPGWEAGRLAAAVPLIEKQLTAVSWVRRVSSPIRAAATSGRRRHSPGWLAFNGFEIRFDEGLRIDTHRGSPVSVPAGSLSFTVGRRGDDERLAPATVTAVSAGEPGRSARTWFATSRSAELVFLTPALAELTAQVESELAAQIRLRTCEWCRQETPFADASCAFCDDVLL